MVFTIYVQLESTYFESSPKRPLNAWIVRQLAWKRQSRDEPTDMRSPLQSIFTSRVTQCPNESSIQNFLMWHNYSTLHKYDYCVLNIWVAILDPTYHQLYSGSTQVSWTSYKFLGKHRMGSVLFNRTCVIPTACILLARAYVLSVDSDWLQISQFNYSHNL